MKRLAAALIGLTCLISAPVARADEAGTILAAVNDERAGAGIDRLTARADWDAACAQHTAYMAANGLLTHTQVVGGTLFSATGAWAAAHAVLARDSAGFRGDPWLSAPLHRFQVLHPWLAQTGVDAAAGYACLVTGDGLDAPSPVTNRILTVPA